MKFGALYSPTDLRDFKVSSSIQNIELPSEFSLNKTTIKNQGNVNSCVAHSLSSMLEEYTEEIYSTGWIYGYRPDDYYQGEGMYPREALKTLQKVGAVKSEIFPYNLEMQEAKTKVHLSLDYLTKQAKEFKIESYVRLYTIKEIKSWLYIKKIAVPISIATDNIELIDNIIQIPKVYPNSGHMMLIVGWNNTGFIIQNSWGEAWGDKGLAILPYEYNVKEAWRSNF